MHYLSKGRLLSVFGIIFFGLWFSIPSFLSKETLLKWPKFFHQDQVTLGLDLQGGSSILLEVDLESVKKDYINFISDEVRRLFKIEKISYINLRQENNSFKFILRRPEQQEKVLKILKALLPSEEVKINNLEITVILTSQITKAREESALKESIDIIRRRIDEMGTKEPSIQKQGKNRILVQLPGMHDPSQIKTMLGKTAKLTFKLLHPSLISSDIQNRPLPFGYEILNGQTEDQKYLVQKKVEISGEMLIEARPTQTPEGEHGVEFSLDAPGARKFAEVTKNNIGRPFAIILDDKIISAPIIRAVISGGRGIISGNFTFDEARDLSSLLRAGALPASLNILEEKTVGPELGSDSIKAGKIATIVSIFLIIFFMFFFYGFVFGSIANICLLINLIILVGGLTLLGATLNLPGIAGIALTLGMAVDANILIFERIREEIRNQQAPLAAIGAGFNRAMTTIIDSNITTIIGALLLYVFGNGPVRGFAVTTTLGILISMFTAITLSRLLILLWIKRWGYNKPLPL